MFDGALATLLASGLNSFSSPAVCFRWTPHPVVVTTRDTVNYTVIFLLLYHYSRVGVLGCVPSDVLSVFCLKLYAAVGVSTTRPALGL